MSSSQIYSCLKFQIKGFCRFYEGKFKILERPCKKEMKELIEENTTRQYVLLM